MIERIDELPWLETQWERLIERWTLGRLPHALLFEGRNGIGKSPLAGLLAKRLVCEGTERGTAPCGRCKQCELVAAASHPDIRTYRPEDSRVIKVDQVRALGEFAVASPQVARHKVIILDSADRLNINSANALLKTLEEPSPDVTLILLQQAGKPLLPTIRSRCQSVLLPGPDADTAADWLASALAQRPESEPVDVALQARALRLANGAPLLARDYIDDGFVGGVEACLNSFRQFLKSRLAPEEATKPFVKLGLENSLGLMERWAADLARLGVGGEPEDPEVADILSYLATHNPPHRVHGILGDIAEARAGLTYNVNPDLEIERLLLAWLTFMPRKQRAG
ncbi:DNA polymerase III subunit delta' [Marinobacter fonticola]|uniref:DNA polymerase III subunit delta' n=1 Tax=Marinobacter fonticola TaxID=2603215 RepID=UPI0011E7F2BE|nr:DNA polymerase III subunit delta' [Marinobacter fonticola]